MHGPTQKTARPSKPKERAISKVVPSQVVALIDRVYPSAKATPSMTVYSGDAAILASIINLVDDIPVELLTLSGDDYTGLVVGLESMGAAIERWNFRGGDDPPRTLDGKSPVHLIRDALSRCPDERPAPTTTELVFIIDDSLRESIRLDISSAFDALHRSDFKAATVLAGAAIEALLLAAVQTGGHTSPPSRMKNKPKDGPETWDLAQFIEAATLLGLIKPETGEQAGRAKNFRNLIHPGRAQRLSESCDRGTALAALAGVELVSRDLQALSKKP
ncbi:hypothetical protein JQ580_14390 [Bradyrhizobium japonicum]|uniref:hypothetical protein n=1 Tax=Bradyrhizobium japonicum TaxID=375 RepID=UPI001BA8DDC5|nr:hypothetical protein [Bradyrhizobium japonicum]MBR0991898.1 hypothetical protein [Bradyrhizobium japonicum]